MKSLILTSLLLIGTNINAFEVIPGEIKVEVSRDNRLASGEARSVNCLQDFTGTHAGNTLRFTPIVFDATGRTQITVYAQFGNAYQLEGRRDGAIFNKTIRAGKSVEVELPKLKDDISFAQQSILIQAFDEQTQMRTSHTLLFNVSRPVRLERNLEAQNSGRSCYEVYPAYRSVSGVLTNGSTNPSQLLIRNGIQEIWNRTRGAQWGFYFSPLAWLGLGSTFSLYANHFVQFSRQTIQTVEVTAGYQLSPGDMVQLYEQRTRYVDVFDAHIVEACGETTKVDGEYYLQWWGTAFHAVPYNPYDDQPVPSDVIGVPTINTCDDDLNQTQTGDFSFVGTI